MLWNAHAILKYTLSSISKIQHTKCHCRIVFDGNFAPSPLNYYNSSIMIYTFGKATLAPGERLGYLALSPKMSISDRVALRESISRACTTGWSRPSSLAGHALKNMDSVLIDIGMLITYLKFLLSSVTTRKITN